MKVPASEKLKTGDVLLVVTEPRIVYVVITDSTADGVTPHPNGYECREATQQEKDDAVTSGTLKRQW